jgi:fluoroquinolone transport system permease protein
MKKLIKVAVNDFRLVFRDNSLKIFIALPLLNLVVIRYVIPYLAGIYGILHDYINIILMLATTQGAIAFGFIYSMVLVDEKDTNVAKVYGVLPVSKFWFTAFRLIPPFFLATLATFALLLVEPFYALPVFSNFVLSSLAGLVAPLMILCIAVVAGNKIEAMTWQKLFNLPLYLPVLSFFVPVPFSLIFAISPVFWTYRGLDFLIRGEGESFWIYTLIGFAASILLIIFLIRKFTRVHFK